MKKNYYYLLFFILLLFTLPTYTNAAVLSLEPGAVQVAPGDTIVFKIKIDNEKDCVNAIETGLKFPKDLLNFKDFASGESMISLWIEKPAALDAKKINEIGEFKFTGGIPGGYCGKIPGDPGDSDMLGEAIFEVKNDALKTVQTQSAQVYFLENSQILKSDGLGTPASSRFNGANLVISDKSSVNKEDWANRLKGDKIPPENFVIELTSEPSLFEGMYYIVFSTTDKQTGVDHYEVREIKMPERIKWWESYLAKIFKPTEPKWQVAAMPYLLKDQSLASTIQVKAIDKAANETLVEYIPPQVQQNTHFDFRSKAAIAGYIIVLILIVLILYLIKSKKKNKTD
jgi:hypothetical protein